MKKSFILTIIIAASFFLVACSQTTPITNFEECVAAGYPVMESYPEQCSDGEETFVKQVNDTDQLTPKACTREYMPVCGEVQVQCITTPCEPINTTFSNTCEAENAGATILYEGECEVNEPNPKGACLSFDGNWLEESQECEGMAKNQCESLGGSYNDCASACRNDPDAQVCTLQCVQVCSFN